jgi:hypothetical protein
MAARVHVPWDGVEFAPTPIDRPQETRKIKDSRLLREFGNTNFKVLTDPSSVVE